MNVVIEDSRNLAHILLNRAAPMYMDADAWDRVYEIAAKQWLIGALSLAIQKMPKQQQPQQAELIECAKEVLAFQQSREQNLKQEIIQLNESLKHYAPVLWLKGADDLLQKTAPQTGARWMMDLDCLISEKQVKNAWQELIEHEYTVLMPEELEYFDWQDSDWHHAPKIVAKNGNIAIEIHRYIGRNYTRNLLPETDFCKQAKKICDWKGNPCYVLNANDGLIHRILHTQVMDESEEKHILGIRYFFHIALYIRKHQAEIDWPTIKTRLDTENYTNTLKRTVYILGWLFGEETPLYDSKCKIGRHYLTLLSNNHSRSISNKFKKSMVSIYRLLTESFSPKFVAISHQKKPENTQQWIFAYIKHTWKLFTKALSKEAWRKKLSHLNKFDW